MKTILKCAHCDDTIDRDTNGYCGENGEDLCQSCYQAIVQTCQLCGDTDVMPNQVSDFILLKWELALRSNLPAGIYHVIQRPFLLGSILGDDSLFPDSVLFVDKLPKPDDHYEISGSICKKCAQSLHPVSARLHGDNPGRLDKERQASHDAHIRKTILASPDMLLDLECDDDNYRWMRFREWYDLPANLKTYHDWLAVKHKGVTVYFCYRDDWGWMTVRPEPKYRNGGSAFTFSVDSLPAYQHPRQDPWPQDRKEGSAARRAIIAAIDQGILTQEGLVHSATK